MQNKSKRSKEIKSFHPPLPAFLSFFQSGVFPDSQQNLAVELTPETREGHRDGYDEINSDNDCACE